MTRPLRRTLLAIVLAACSHAGGFATEGDQIYAPAGIDTSKRTVDGLTMGHRLMAAGQYELALKAFLRGAAEEGETVEVLTALGSANLKLGRLGQAEDLLRRAVEVDETFVPAWNNLGVVLMERGKTGEAARVFRNAFALDSGKSDRIRKNLTLALEKLDERAYSERDNENLDLVRLGTGEYRIRSAP